MWRPSPCCGAALGCSPCSTVAAGLCPTPRPVPHTSSCAPHLILCPTPHPVPHTSFCAPHLVLCPTPHFVPAQLLGQLENTGPPPADKEKISSLPTVAVTQDQVGGCPRSGGFGRRGSSSCAPPPLRRRPGAALAARAGRGEPPPSAAPRPGLRRHGVGVPGVQGGLRGGRAGAAAAVQPLLPRRLHRALAGAGKKRPPGSLRPRPRAARSAPASPRSTTRARCAGRA